MKRSPEFKEVYENRVLDKDVPYDDDFDGLEEVLTKLDNRRDRISRTLEEEGIAKQYFTVAAAVAGLSKVEFANMLIKEHSGVKAPQFIKMVKT